MKKLALFSRYRLYRGAGAWTPASLFTSGVAGAWYDPSDINNYMAGLGSELVTNGDFSSASGWSTGGAWVISSGAASITSSTASLSQSTLSAVAGKTYAVTFTISAFTTGGIRVEFGGVNGASRTAAGTYTQYFTATSTSFLVVSPVATSTLSVDDISVKEVTTIANATLFQDSAGTTPVTAVEQPVGLMLDKSQGLVLGSDTGTDFSSASGWTLGSGFSISGGKLNMTAVAAGGNSQRTGGTLYTIGKTQYVTVVVESISGGSISISAGSAFTISSAGTYTARVTAAVNNYLIVLASTGTVTAVIDSITVQELAGNHARAPNDLSRPVLRARYNFFTYSEDFSNAAWKKSTTPAPTLTNQGSGVWRLQASAGSWLLYQTVTTFSSGNSTFAIEVKSNGAGLDTFRFMRSGVAVAGNLTATSDWVRYTTTGVNTGSCDIGFIYSSSSTAIDVLIRFPSLVAGSSAGTYQRIAAATDYATAGFLPYLAFDGSDDSMSTASIDFTGTDKMSVFSGVTKLSDASTGTIASTNPSGLPGFFELFAPRSTATNDFAFWSVGTFLSQANSASSYASPITAVLTGRSDISGDSSTLRFNGSQVASSTADQGTGNYGNYPLYIGRRNNTIFPFNGRIYQLIVCGKTLSASELASTEAYVATKTGVTLLVPTFDYYTTADGDFIILDNGDNVVSDTYYV